jgi:hypothetical protein
MSDTAPALARLAARLLPGSRHHHCTFGPVEIRKLFLACPDDAAHEVYQVEIRDGHRAGQWTVAFRGELHEVPAEAVAP